ncbi:MAG: hypothetical protein K9G76_03285 [Bacteroidales bacterium]|nr:hypothetical protein [Bacteroidales bacterium]MCF8402816.1 hypothetical protein [Bacteroidales bacterium]
MERYTESVDNFLCGMMSPQENEIFLNEVENNESLKKELHFQEELRNTINDAGFVTIRNVLNKRRTAKNPFPFKIPYNQKRGKYYIYAAAASLALLIASGLLYFFLNGQIVAPEQIAQKYYKPAYSIHDYRSIEDQDLSGNNEAFSLYNNGEYAKSLELFLLFENKVVSNFYTGICYYELHDYRMAEQSFNYVYMDQTNLFIEQAEWYLALTYLQQNKVTEAKEIFGRIKASKSPFALQSSEILKKLD